MISSNQREAEVVCLESNMAWVRVAERPHACGVCASRDHCTAGAQDDERLLCLDNSIRAQPGDLVFVELAGGQVWRAAWYAYGLPLMLALLTAVSLQGIYGNEWLTIGGLLIGLAAGFFVLKQKRNALDQRMTFKLASHSSSPSVTR